MYLVREMDQLYTKTPISVAQQLEAMIADRGNKMLRYWKEIEKEKSAFEKTYKGLQGWGDRFEKASLKSMVGGGRIDAANTAADHVNIMKKAYELGKNI